jgi:23S rRNA pseudouridine1911/1915/1917 synthase
MTKESFKTIVVSELGDGKRLDVWLSKRFPSFSRHFWTKLIDKGAITISREDNAPGKVRASRKVLEHDKITIDTKQVRGIELEHTYSGTIDVIYEDDILLAVRKPAGLLTHPAGKFGAGSLMDILIKEHGPLYLCGRLDRFTSGIVLLVKDGQNLLPFDNAVERHLVCKEYLAITDGVITPPSGTISAPIDHDESSEILLKMAVIDSGKSSITHYETLKSTVSNSLLLCRIETGRKHQIRVHLSNLGYPVVNDKLYGKEIDYEYFTPMRGNLHSYWPSWHGLHCYRMTINASVFSTKEDVVITCPLFGEMAEEAEKLFPPDTAL